MRRYLFVRYLKRNSFAKLRRRKSNGGRDLGYLGLKETETLNSSIVLPPTETV